MAQNRHEGEDIPQATHLFGGIVTVHATHLTVIGLILLMIVTDHTPRMIEDDHTRPMTGADHTRLTTADGIAQDLHTATAQGLHTATEDGGQALMTGLCHHTTGDTIIDQYPGHQVLLLGAAEGGAILVVHLQRVVCLAAVPWYQEDLGAILQRKGIVKGNPHVAGLQARGVVQGKATHTAVVLTRALSLGSVQLELEV